MNTMKRRENIIKELKDKQYRDAFVSSHIDIGIPHQIRALRDQRKWTQHELAQHAAMKQERISVLENPNYGKYTLQTLKKIASAFDIALIVRFVPISDLVKWELNLSPEVLEAVSFNEDCYFMETPQQEYYTAYSQPEPPNFSYVGSGGFCLGREGKVEVIYPAQAPKTKTVTDIDVYKKSRGMMEKRQEETKPLLPTLMMGVGQ